MKLASINQGRDGQLIVVNSQMQLYTSATDIAPTLQAALDNWDDCKEPLETLYNQLENSQIVGRLLIQSSAPRHCPALFNGLMVAPMSIT
jgi:fumarylacetoacetate (FAA) hydrolase